MDKFTAFEIAEEAFAIASRELNNARHALGRSKSKANIARFADAEAAFEVRLAKCIAARDAYEDEIFTAKTMDLTAAAMTNEVQLEMLN